ncbi:hypothetical protein DY000_02006711 [Brassica cretica]|uniref:Uncharacterized protein n=1 Tax=Brassica cretica TaxID=69181 RepID=A0ABQ7BT09_BRACR|nr:hypothetical protein DY000_02006711 [Brassica cretica]
MIWLRHMGASIEEQTRMHGFGSYPLIDVRDSVPVLQGFSLNPALEKRLGLSADVRSQNCCSIFDVNRLSDWSGGHLIIMAWMKTVFSRIAKDVVGKGPDHGTFVLRLSSKRMLNSGSGFTGRRSWPRAKSVCRD